MSSLQLPLSSLEYFLNLLASFNPYLKDMLLNSAQGSLVAEDRRPKWLQKTCWGKAGRHWALLLLWGCSQWARRHVQQLLLCSQATCAGKCLHQGRGRQLPWGGCLGTGSGSQKKVSVLSIADGMMLEIFPWSITKLSDSKSLYKIIQRIIHIYTYMYVFQKPCSHLLEAIILKIHCSN